MPAYHFTLTVEGPDLQDAGRLDALYEAGCGDALVGRGHGVQYLDFDRDAPTPEDAVASAIADVGRVDCVSVVRVLDPGVGLSPPSEPR